MKIDEMFLIGGSDIPVFEGVTVRQPRLNEIRASDTGYERYLSYVNTFGLTLSALCSGERPLLPVNLPEHLKLFDLLLIVPQLRTLLTDAMRFFLLENVTLDASRARLTTERGGVIDRDNYGELRNVVLTINGVAAEAAETPKYAGKTAERIYEKIRKGRSDMAAVRAKNGGDHLSLTNMISKLSAKSPTYNLTNIWNLTVWQLLDQFGCVSLNHQLDIISTRWAVWGTEKFDFDLWYKEQNREN